MAIKDIFTMIKADRYTSDGREELIKAQEAVTEDVTYKPGDISRKTGLQKQPDGSWAPVKNAPAQSKKMDKAKQSEIAKQAEFEKTVGDPAKARADYWKEMNEASNKPMPGVEELYNKTVGSGKMFDDYGLPTEETITKKDEFLKRENITDPGKLKNADFNALAQKLDKELGINNLELSQELLMAEHEDNASGSAPSAPKFETEQENAKYEEGLKGWDDVNPDRLPDIKKKVEQKIDYYKKYDPYAMLGKKTGLTAAQKSAVQQNMAQAKENLAFYTGQLEGINKKMGGGSAPSDLKIQGMSKEEYIPWRMKTYKENEAQASSMWNHFAEQQKNKGKENEYDPDFHPLRDSAPRILTGDCKVRIKKSK